MRDALDKGLAVLVGGANALLFGKLGLDALRDMQPGRAELAHDRTHGQPGRHDEARDDEGVEGIAKYREGAGFSSARRGARTKRSCREAAFVQYHISGAGQLSTEKVGWSATWGSSR